MMKKTILFILPTLFLLLPLKVEAQQPQPSADERTKATEAFIRGVMQFENEEYDLALESLTAAHVHLSDEPGVNYALADLYLAKGDLINAAYYGKEAVDRSPENKWYHLKLAEIYQKAGRNEATVEAFKSALEYHPDDLNILRQLAATHVRFGELLKSNEIYDRIMERTGSDFDIHLRKFRNYNALQMRKEALDELQQMRKLEPGNLATLRTISQYYLDLDEEELALEVLNEARERNARDPQTLLLLAEIHTNNSDWDRLGDIFVTMLSDPLIDPSHKLELVRFIYMQHQQYPGDEKLADQTADVLLAFSDNEPEYGPAQLLAAEFFQQRDEIGKALEKLRIATSLMPGQPDAWRMRMQLHFSKDEYEEVISIADSANSNAPDDAFIQFFAGASYMLTDQPEEARTWFEDAVLSPANRNFRSVIHGALGDVLQDLDKWEEARDSYESALRLDRNNHTAMNNYAYFMSLREENLDYALELAERAVSHEPQNAAYLDTIGWVYFKLGEYENARRYIQRSVDTGEASAEVYEHLGDVYEALGDNENAVKWWNKALEEDSDRDYLNERIDSVSP